MRFNFKAHFLQLAVSTSLKREVTNMYKADATFPKDEAGIDELLTKIEGLLPKGIPDGLQKTYIKYLLKQLYRVNPPGWNLDEDEPRVQSTLAAFELAKKERRISGEAANIDSYETLADAMTAATGQKEEKDAGMRLSELPEQGESTKGGQPGFPRKAVEEGAEIIAQAGGWKVYRLTEADPKGKEAGSWLGMNGWWGGSWCVGRDYSGDAWKGRPYMDQGNFYFFAKDDKIQWPMSTDGQEATLWNKADNPIWTTGTRSEGRFPSLEAAAAQMGVQLSLAEISSLPVELVPILRETVKVDTYLAGLIPESQLVEVKTDDLDRVVAAVSADDLIADLNKNSGDRAKGVVSGILSRCVSKANQNGIKNFTGKWDAMTEATLISYIEALAAQGWKALPQSLEDYLVEAAEQFEF